MYVNIEIDCIARLHRISRPWIGRVRQTGRRRTRASISPSAGITVRRTVCHTRPYCLRPTSDPRRFPQSFCRLHGETEEEGKVINSLLLNFFSIRRATVAISPCRQANFFWLLQSNSDFHPISSSGRVWMNPKKTW